VRGEGEGREKRVSDFFETLWFGAARGGRGEGRERGGRREGKESFLIFFKDPSVSPVLDHLSVYHYDAFELLPLVFGMLKEGGGRRRGGRGEGGGVTEEGGEGRGGVTGREGRGVEEGVGRGRGGDGVSVNVVRRR
jgi:hypothetical protein